jgi:hypothetical protein
VQSRVCVDKRQILALLRREAFRRATHSGHPIQPLVRASNYEEAQINVRYRVELTQAERRELSERGQERGAQAQASADFAADVKRNRRRSMTGRACAEPGHLKAQSTP